MRIRMKETRRGAEDGFTVKEYRAGREYELAATPRGEDLGAVFIREGWAEEIRAAAAPAAPEGRPQKGGGSPGSGAAGQATRKG